MQHLRHKEQLTVLNVILRVDSFQSCFFNIFIIENYITDPEHTIGCNATNQISWQSALILQNNRNVHYEKEKVVQYTVWYFAKLCFCFMLEESTYFCSQDNVR